MVTLEWVPTAILYCYRYVLYEKLQRDRSNKIKNNLNQIRVFFLASLCSLIGQTRYNKVLNKLFNRLSHDKLGHLSCRSRRFDCLLLVFIGWWGRMPTLYHLYHGDLFVPVSSGVLGDLTQSCSLGGRSGLPSWFLIFSIHASGISIPLSLLMLLGWILM